MKPKTFKNAEEFTRYIEGLTGKPFKAAASTDGTTAHKYLNGQRDYTNLFTDGVLSVHYRNRGITIDQQNALSDGVLATAATLAHGLSAQF